LSNLRKRIRSLGRALTCYSETRFRELSLEVKKRAISSYPAGLKT